jgi:hypothetical protein
MNRFEFEPPPGMARWLGTRLMRRSRRWVKTLRGGQDPEPPDVERISEVRRITSGPLSHFFGYYNHCPWNATGQFVLAHQVGISDRMPERGETATVGIVDLESDCRFIPLAHTTAWCWQQGAMLRWLGTSPDRRVVYNIHDGSAYRSVVHDIFAGAIATLPRPVYDVSDDGCHGLSIDFARLDRHQRGYGYVAHHEPAKNRPCPDDDGIYWMDMATGESRLIISLEWAAANRTDERFSGASHWFCPLKFNPSGSHFLFLHRWTQPGMARHTRLYTAAPDGTDVRMVCDTGMISHFDWRDDETILAWSATDRRECRFQTFDIRSGNTEIVGEGVLVDDGHCTYSPTDRDWILNDTYPDQDGYQSVMLYHAPSCRRFELFRCRSPAALTRSAIRCDLHPRWDRSGAAICFDSAHTGTRQVYIADVRNYLKPESSGRSAGCRGHEPAQSQAHHRPSREEPWSHGDGRGPEDRGSGRITTESG